ncbi:MAG: MFS transporter [Dehalococcoidia bacterium]|nr:MFS transporter [Dehalococcoidia bacterium]
MTSHTAAQASELSFVRRWLPVALAACFINTSYGTLSYAFSVLVTESAAGGTFGRGVVSGGFALGLLVSGVIAIPAGTVADIWGTRRLMAGGAALGCAGLALLAACQEPWQVLAVSACVLGPAMAATFYEPVYVLMNRWFEPFQRPRAYGVLTLLSGFSVTIFTPLTRWLVDALEWREATVVLGVILLAVGLLVPPLLPAGPPARAARGRASFLRETVAGLRNTTPRFWAFSLAFFAATAALSGFSFHMVAQLETRGFEPSSVAAAVAITGIVSLPARLILPALSGRAPSSPLLAVCLVLLGLAAWIASSAAHWWQVWVYVAVFGAVFGAVYPLRALVMSEWFDGPFFGRLIGIQALLLAAGRAAGPAVVGAVGSDPETYQLAFRISAVVLMVTALAGWLALRGHPGPLSRSGAGSP